MENTNIIIFIVIFLLLIGILVKCKIININFGSSQWWSTIQNIMRKLPLITLNDSSKKVANNKYNNSNIISENTNGIPRGINNGALYESLNKMDDLSYNDFISK